MPPELKQLLRYWSLTFAVLFIYLFAMVVAGLDVADQVMDTVRKRRPQLKAKGPLPDSNPLQGKTVAETLGIGPGQQPDAKRQWVLDLVTDVARTLNLTTLRVIVLEDSKEHPLVHFHDGKQLRSYRIDKTWVAEGRAGNSARVQQIRELVERYLAADFLGQQARRPPRTTELAREAASKAAASPAKASPETPQPPEASEE